MQSMPLLLRHSLRSSLALTRTSRPLRGTPLATAAAGPSPFLSRKDSRRDFSVCLRCQFRARPSFYYSSHETDKPKDENNPTERKQEEKKEEEEVNPPATTTSTTTTTTSTTAANEPAKQPEVQAEGEQRTQSAAPPENHENSQQRYEPEHEDVRRPEAPEDQGLPSTMERRRSQWSKQFSEMMDNVQSNIFVAGQRLNDLTGYSAIETLKKEIHEQEAQLRAARAHVRQTKDNYTAAINRRSTSQREVNELLQRKHAWSAADLERFTHLYRNDHANEVGENEAQEAFSVAEREAEEAAAILSKSILSRYHEEQVWSDKIRRMSTWGTWGLMGVNVLLFLVFQIAVEPWRRSRLVRGFEEKVLEALQKNNAEVADIHNHFYTTAREEVLDSSDSESIPIADASEPIKPTTEAIPPANETPTTDTPALKPSSSTGETTPTAAAAAPTTPTSILETGKFHLSRFVSRFVSLLPSASTESWRNTLHDLFSDRSITITQCDLTTIALQSAAAGAAAMGLVIALIRPR